MRRLAVSLLIIIIFFLAFSIFEWRTLYFGLTALTFLIILGVYDYFQKKHTILRNFPVIGHFRFLLEFIRPEIRQYFIASNTEERPFNRETRSIAYQRAKGVRDTVPYGTQHDIKAPGYESLRHSLRPTKISEEESRFIIGGPSCKQPYNSSRLNVSGMSFGAISKNAVLALNMGAKLGNFAQNTGEGGLSEYHLAPSGDIIWQLGTAYFGCRKPNGRFNPDVFVEKCNAYEQIKMIEIKIGQGAKPSHGAILPKAKITSELAAIRQVRMDEDCLSPPTHPEFSTPQGLLEFIQYLRELSNGKPIGFKIAIGRRSEFLSICKAMLKFNILPDFITIDGAEGGTGAAPLEFCDYVGEPIEDALMFVNNALIGIGLRDKICLVASGKVVTGFDMVKKLSVGADVCNSARAMMFALGCIQSLQCNTNTCPTGVATQNPRLIRGLVPIDKYKRVATYHKATIDSLLELSGALGVQHLDDLDTSYIFRRNASGKLMPLSEWYEQIPKDSLLSNNPPMSFQRDWEQSCIDRF